MVIIGTPVFRIYDIDTRTYSPLGAVQDSVYCATDMALAEAG